MTVAIAIQARTGSSRLPGKVMYPLAGRSVITALVEQVSEAATADNVVVATSDQERDDVICRHAERAGVDTFRGSETDVLGRMYCAVAQYDPTIVVRICGDCPLVPPSLIDATVEASDGVDYASTKVERTLPLGLDAEAFTFESFGRVEASATSTHYREHVTPYYLDHPDQFDIESVDSSAIFDEDAAHLHRRTDLRLTLDRAADYERLSRMYDALGEQPTARDAIEFLDSDVLESAEYSRPVASDRDSNPESDRSLFSESHEQR